MKWNAFFRIDLQNVSENTFAQFLYLPLKKIGIMKNALKIIILAFVSGLAGAYLMMRVNPTPVREVIREVPNFTQANYAYEEPNEKAYEPTEVRSAPADFREAANRSVHSVVYIKNLQNNRRNMSFMDYFYGREVPSREVAVGSGSGVIYSSDGYIITNSHVIKGADEIEVLHEKRTYRATLVGADPKMDIAVLKIEANGLPQINIASSSSVKVGDWVLAVGNPFNLTSTVTAGIVSALGGEANAVRENFPIEQYIQTDAAINPGNSGGALVNTHGELVGINTSIISRTGSYAGYGFAVPSDIVVKIVEDLKNYKVVQKAFIGAEVIDINEELAAQAALNSLKGVMVNRIREGSAAEEAGLRRGDIIRRLDNKPIISQSSFEEVISAKSPGDLISITFERSGKAYATDLVLENIYGDTEILGANALSEEDFYFSDYLGAELRKLNADEKSKYSLKMGVRITSIDNNSGFMRRLDLKEGDIIVTINRRLAVDPKAVAEYIEKYYGRIYFEVIGKDGKQRTLTYQFN